MRQKRESFGWAVMAWLAIAPAATAEPLTEALLRLRQRGLNLVFSSQVVKPEMQVLSPPTAATLRRILQELLSPHGLDVREGPGGVLIVVKREEPETPEATPKWSEEIVVQPSRISLLVDDPSAPMTLTREQIQLLPHLGDDALRTLSLMPGTASGDVSAQVHIRGGRRDELMILLDGQELYEPYHLREYDNALSIIGASSLAAAHLITAAFPASYGDRAAGVLNLSSIEPAGERRVGVELSFLGLRVDAADTHRGGRIGWIASLRRGSTDLLGQIFKTEKPRFWDFFGKLNYELAPAHTLALRALVSDDKVDFRGGVENKRLDTEHQSSYLWLTHRALLGSRGFVDTTTSSVRLTGERHGFEEDDERSYDVRDERSFDGTSASQTWNLGADGKHFLSAGAEYQKFRGRYDYFSSRKFTTPLVELRAEPRDGDFAFDRSVGSERLGVHLSDHVTLPAVGIDAGLRYDRHSLTDESTVSPRVAAAWGFGDRGVVRVAWGRYSQSQRVFELMVEDADTRFYPVERSEQWVVGFERLLASTALRAEIYRRTVKNPRPRYENLFKPFDPFPEGEIDRVRIQPERSKAEGFELSMRGRARSRLEWWLNYAWATSTDRLDGRDIPRRIDQTHALNVDVNYRLTRRWNVNGALLYHRGWPITPLESMTDLGPMNSRRLPDYWRVDLRVSREWRSWVFFADVQNLFGLANVSGLDANFEAGELVIREEHWPGFVASAGIAREFR